MALSITSIVLDIKSSNSNYIRLLVNDFIINPIQYLVKAPSGFFEDFVQEKKSIEELNNRILVLEKENTSLKVNIQRIDILENEVSRLRSIKTKVNKTIKSIKIASVSRKDVIPNKKSIEISVGSDDGIKIGQTVFGTNGLIGQVVEVNMTSSKVLLITDNNSNVPGLIVRTGKHVIVKGSPSGKMLEISFLPNESDIKSGDLISTSGQAGRYLESIKIGRITEIIKNDGERFATVVVEPIEDSDVVNEVILSMDKK